MGIFLFSVRAKKVSIYGTVYKIGSVTHIGWVDELPEFGVISKIVVMESSEVHFLLKRYETIQFASHYHSYEVNELPNERAVLKQQTEFRNYLPSHVVKLSNVSVEPLYVASRCQVPNC